MNEKQKTLVCGDVNGKFNTLYSRVEALIQKSGPFDVLLCVGSFFGDDNSQFDAYRMGTKTVPLATYILGPMKKEDVKQYCEEGGEIVPNVVYLGKRGIYTTSFDIKTAYVSGYSRTETEDHETLCTFEPSDCGAVRDACLRGQNEYRGVDILMTSLWPRGAQVDDQTKIELPKNKLSDLISWLALHIKPRYHFVASPDKYFERRPYRNVSVEQDFREVVTRLIGIAPVGNKAKEKWLYACNLQPISSMRMTDLLQATTDETQCPYDISLLKQHQPGKAVKYTGNGQFFFDMDSTDDNSGRKRKHGDGNKERKKIQFDQETCWFCLSSSGVQKQLIVCVGQSCYVALARGPLAPHHCLILPIAHHQSYVVCPNDVIEELKKFKEAIKKMFASMDLLVVFFERNYKSSHMQVQCVPVPKILQGELAEVFQDEAGLESIQLEVLPPYADISQVATRNSPYFHVELPSGEQLFTRCKQNFPLQFARDVLASKPLLNCEDKADWRACTLSKEEDIRLVKNFRAAFKPFDFTASDSDNSDSE